MIDNKKTNLSIKGEIFWAIVLTLFFTINMNKDWNRSYLIWYGILALVVISYFLVFRGQMVVRNSKFILWMLALMALGLVSILWCLSVDMVFDVLKNLLICFAVILFIQFSIENGFRIDTILIGYFIATLITALYILFTIDLAQLGDTQLGVEIIEGWNGNGIGFMMAQGALIGVYLSGKSDTKVKKILSLLGIIFLSILTMFTGSRTAFIVLVGGFILYFCFLTPSKIFKNLFISAIVITLAFIIIMNNESFYKVLGSRFEGLFALFTGEGTVDGSSKIRDIFIENGKQWFTEHPILGVGLNNYKVLNQGATGRFTYAHNNFIEIAVNLGLVGLILYYSVYVYLIKNLIKTAKNNKMNAFLLSALIVSLISHYGTVSYYDFYQNFLLFLCFYMVGKFKQKKDNV